MHSWGHVGPGLLELDFRRLERAPVRCVCVSWVCGVLELTPETGTRHMCAAATATASSGLTSLVSTAHWVACWKVVVGCVRCSAVKTELVIWAAAVQVSQPGGQFPCYHTMWMHSSMGGFAVGLIMLWLWVYSTWRVKSCSCVKFRMKTALSVIFGGKHACIVLLRCLHPGMYAAGIDCFIFVMPLRYVCVCCCTTAYKRGSINGLSRQPLRWSRWGVYRLRRYHGAVQWGL